MRTIDSQLIDANGNVHLELLLYVAESFADRLRGLLWREQTLDQAGLLLTPCASVHTFGLKNPIDIVFLDNTDRIIGLRQQVCPGRVRWENNAHKAIELASRQAQRYRIANGMFWLQINARHERKRGN